MFSDHLRLQDLGLGAPSPLTGEISLRGCSLPPLMTVRKRKRVESWRVVAACVCVAGPALLWAAVTVGM